MQCTGCAGEQFIKAGRDRQQRQVYRCSACGRRITARSSSAFSGYRFPDEIIALAVHWYVRYRLSYADVGEWLAERGVTVDPARSMTESEPSLRASSRQRGPIGHTSVIDGGSMRRISRSASGGTSCSARSTSMVRSWTSS